MHPQEGKSRLTEGVYRGQERKGISIRQLHVGRDRDRKGNSTYLRLFLQSSVIGNSRHVIWFPREIILGQGGALVFFNNFKT